MCARAAPRSVGLARELHSVARDGLFVGVRAPGNLLDGLAIAVARGEVLERVDPGRVLAEDGLDGAAPLEEDVPVERREEAEADDAIADGDLVARLPPVLAAEDLSSRRSRAGPSSASEEPEGRRRTSGRGRGRAGAGGRRRGRSPRPRPREPRPCVPPRSPLARGRRGRPRASAAQRSARRRSSHLQSICSERRLRFSSRTRRSIVGRAQSSPIVRGVTSWNARTNPTRRASSSSLSVWATRASARA
jgi:hypothetical protein